jgi:hypothetical protein
LPFDQMAVGLLFVALGAVAAFTPAQNDTFWHLRAGAEIWRTGQVPRVDTYSYTAAGAPWLDHEWLSQALLYAVYRAGGMPGLEIGAAALVLATAATVYCLMVGPRLTRFALMAVGLAVSSCAWALRPQMLSLLLLVLLVWLLARGRTLLIPPLFMLWANAHGGVALGGAVLVAATAIALGRALRLRAAPERRRAFALAVALPLSGLAAAATPLGFGIFRFVIASTARSYGAQISEWYPASPDTALGAAFWVVALAFVALLFGRRRALAEGTWADWVICGAALTLLPFAGRSLRNIGPFLTLAIPAASRLLGADFRLGASRGAGPPEPDLPRANLALLAGACLAAILIVPVAWNHASEHLGWRPIGDGALRALRECDGPLYNQYEDGGTLIWFAPDRRVFIDGRQDPYSPAFLREDLAIERGGSYRPTFDHYGIRCAFLAAASKMTAQLRAAGWRERYADGKWSVLVAPDAG